MSSPDSKKRWVEVGRSTTTDPKNKVRKEIELDDYYLVVGFEVNKPDAFKDNTHDLAIDYGHAFFYIVKNKIITKVFSFGPAGLGKTGWLGNGELIGRNGYNRGAIIKDGYMNARPGTPDYAITETVKAFKVALTPQQGKALEEETDSARKEILEGEQQYTAYINDTCAETAREILDEAGVSTPSGSGKVKNSSVASFSIAYAVNPYMWHHNFRKSGHNEVEYHPPVGKPWKPPIGRLDPIFGNTK
ncbi:hypothetical protein [Pseudoduganella sp.]|uniref:hypothetical protein n=1 Tax=Pseudoduganella sp. TaxID=1880898 RepID=UPI0035B40DC7